MRSQTWNNQCSRKKWLFSLFSAVLRNAFPELQPTLRNHDLQESFFFWRGEKVEYLVQCSFTLWAIAFVVLNTVQWRLGSTVIQLSHVALKSQSLPFSRPDHFLGFTEELLTTLNSEMTLLGNSAEHSHFLLNSNGFTANFLLNFILRKFFFFGRKIASQKKLCCTLGYLTETT